MARLAELPNLGRDWALFLDIDGTLLDIAATPETAIVPAELPGELTALARELDGALALVSGRSIASIDALFDLPELAAAGQHGAELRLGGDHATVPPHPRFPTIAVMLRQFAAEHPGVRVEDKGRSIALHYRLAPELADQAHALAARAIVGIEDELGLMPGHMVVDIKPQALSKGSAIDWFMARPPFKDRVPVFAGDDRTDEDGFAVVNGRRGFSIRVGATGETIAHFCIASPAALREWVATSVRYVEQGEPL